jgi:hypothetical protein
MLYFQLAALGIEVLDLEGTQFQCPQAGVEQGEDDGLVAVGSWPAHHEAAAVDRICLSRINAGLQHPLDIVLCERLDRCVLGGQGACIASKPDRDIFGSQIKKMGFDILFGDLGYLNIPSICGPLLKRSLVGIYRALGQAFGCFMVREADYGLA